MVEKKFTQELQRIFEYIKENLLKEYPTDVITAEYFMLAILENDYCVAYRALSKTMLDESMNVMKEWYYQYLSANSKQITSQIKFDKSFDLYIDNISSFNDLGIINSGLLLCSIFQKNKQIAQSFKYVSVTHSQLYKCVMDETEIETEETVIVETSDKPVKHEKKQNKVKTTAIISNKPNKNEHGETEKNLININNLASEGKIEEVYGNENIYERIFNTFAKKNRNNVLIVGDNGIGKTATVRNIANKIISNDVPRLFVSKVLMEMDFTSLVSGMAIRGMFEAKYKSIIDDAKQKNKYIFFIDDLQNILSDKARYSEMNIESVLDMILKEKNILFISTISTKGYSNFISNNNFLANKLHVIRMEEMNEEKSIEVLNKTKYKYQTYHNVEYSDDAISASVKLCKRYINDKKLPDVALDLLDEVGAKFSIKDDVNKKIIKLEKELNECFKTKEELKQSFLKSDFDKIDEITLKEIDIKSKLNIEQKKLILNKKPQLITENDIREIVSSKTNIPLTQISVDERERLKNINNIIKEHVIGQDEAVDDVCKVIKRQRIGLANPNKPSVLFFGGSTGTGKSYLAKKIAEQIFGNEKYLVRLDMSEYADKMSVNRLYGSSPGYVGYEEGGYLTEAIKKNKYCVLLLDEIEKASEEVHNVFLQLFDEGRLTDNKGVTVDFKNVIVIMTSNVGAKEISENGKSIGFKKDVSSKTKDIITKSLKKKFKPEFLNRIDKIVYFNSLDDDNIKNIIKLELKKLENKINGIGYIYDDSLKDENIVNQIFERVKEENEYGARPILKQIQTLIEDRITDYLIEVNPNKGSKITYKDINNF